MKTRPVIVVSNNIGNKYSGTVTIIPITSQNLERIYPFEVFLPKGEANLPKNSKIKIDQIRTVDKSRITSLAGNLKNDYLEKINSALKIHLDFFLKQ